MNVLHVISSGGMYGAEAVILHLAAELDFEGSDRSGIAVFQHAERALPELYRVAGQAGLAAHLIECRGQLDVSAVRRIRSLVATVGADVVHAHGYKADLYTYAALGVNRHVPLVSTCHTWYDNGVAVRVYGAADRWVLRHFDEVVAVSADVRNRLLRAGVPEGRVHLIRNGVEVKPMEVADPGSSDGIAGVPLRVGLVGRLAPEKGIDVFLQAAALVRAELPEARFVVAGGGPERGRLEGQRARLGMEDWVAMPGVQNDMQAFYASLDVLVSASRQEGLPMALLEGMASGLPVVATRVGEVPAVVEDGVTGWLVAPETAPDLAAAIARLLRDAGLRTQMGAAGRARVAHEFSAERMAGEYREVYARALKRQRLRRPKISGSAA